MAKFSVDVKGAQDPIVLALDVGSTGSRGCLYDGTGRSISKRRDKIPHEFTTHIDGKSTIDPDQVVDEIRELIDYLLQDDVAHRIRAVAIDTFAASLLGVDENGEAVTPVLTYADSRSADHVDQLRKELDEDEVTERTGARLHTSHLPAMLRWAHRERPETSAKVARWMSLGEYIWLKFLGHTAVSTSSAAWSGLLNRHTGDWDDQMLEVSGISRDMLSPIAKPTEPLYPKSDYVDRHWPSLTSVPWFPCIPDGLASSLGAGVSGPEVPVASFSTSGAMRVIVPGVPESIPQGLWCYRIDDERSIVGGALNDVGRMVTWMENVFQLPDLDRRHELLMADPDAATPLVLPFLTGERATGWASDARAVLRDVAYAEGPEDIYRGCLEGVALSYVRLAREVVKVAGNPDRLRASGRVANNIPGLVQIVADASGLPVEPIDIKRSTLHGTALFALEVIAPSVTKQEVPLREVHEPHEDRAPYYAERLRRFEDLYDATITRRIGAEPDGDEDRAQRPVSKVTSSG